MKNVKQMENLKELDKKILKQLLTDCRKSLRQLASVLKVSVVTLSKRIREMEMRGIIKGYSAILDHEKLGYDLGAIIEVTVSKGKLIEVEKKIAKLPNVLGVYDVTGASDAIIIAKFKNRKELDRLIKGLLRMEYVERTNTHVVLNTVKEDFRLL